MSLSEEEDIYKRQLVLNHSNHVHISDEEIYALDLSTLDEFAVASLQARVPYVQLTCTKVDDEFYFSSEHILEGLREIYGSDADIKIVFWEHLRDLLRVARIESLVNRDMLEYDKIICEVQFHWLNTCGRHKEVTQKMDSIVIDTGIDDDGEYVILKCSPGNKLRWRGRHREWRNQGGDEISFYSTGGANMMDRYEEEDDDDSSVSPRPRYAQYLTDSSSLFWVLLRLSTLGLCATIAKRSRFRWSFSMSSYAT